MFVVAVLVVLSVTCSGSPSISSLKCREYSRHAGECNVRDNEPLVLGKQRAKGREFPHMAHVGFTDDDGEVVWQCGGSLISPSHVLTAAQCQPRSNEPSWVLLGELDHDSGKDDARPEKIAVAAIIAHPDFKAPVSYNDIAVLRLERPANLSAYVRPACLHAGPHLPPGQRAVATGWGSLAFGEEPASHLHKVSLPITNYSACASAYSGSGLRRRLPDGIRDASQLCAGNVAGEGDTCQGDSGGPLQVPVAQAPCMYQVVGVTSFGKACDVGEPGVYTRVGHFAPWIESVVWP